MKPWIYLSRSNHVEKYKAIPVYPAVHIQNATIDNNHLNITPSIAQYRWGLRFRSRGRNANIRTRCAGIQYRLLTRTHTPLKMAFKIALTMSIPVLWLFDSAIVNFFVLTEQSDGFIECSSLFYPDWTTQWSHRMFW